MYPKDPLGSNIQQPHGSLAHLEWELLISVGDVQMERGQGICVLDRSQFSQNRTSFGVLKATHAMISKMIKNALNFKFKHHPKFSTRSHSSPAAPVVPSAWTGWLLGCGSWPCQRRGRRQHRTPPLKAAAVGISWAIYIKKWPKLLDV